MVGFFFFVVVVGLFGCLFLQNSTEMKLLEILYNQSDTQHCRSTDCDQTLYYQHCVGVNVYHICVFADEMLPLPSIKPLSFFIFIFSVSHGTKKGGLGGTAWDWTPVTLFIFPWVWNDEKNCCSREIIIFLHLEKKKHCLWFTVKCPSIKANFETIDSSI